MTKDFTTAELEALLGRPTRAAVGPEERAAAAGRRVLVTGAAGSIGAELAREVAASTPSVLVLVDHSELGLFTIEREIRSRWPAIRLEACLVDVAHRAAMERVFTQTRPDTVYHAAAYKHVTMAERAPASAVRVNVMGSIVVANAAAAVGAEFVLISSDKAANPESVMGATKRAAETAILNLASPTFRPIVVRFGNVIGSSGSVVALMREAVREGRPVSVTDPDATRYFMTAGEAVALVMRARRLARGPEIFWLDMGEPVRLGDLVERLLDAERSAGYAVRPVEIIGLRPGEKRNETLTDARLCFHRTIDARILVAREAKRPATRVQALLAQLVRAARRADDRAALAGLTTLLDDFSPSAQALAAAADIPASAPARLRRRRRAA